jgi:hypothetical protein
MLRPLSFVSLALAGVMTLALVTESAAAFRFGGVRGFSGMRGGIGMRTTSIRVPRVTTGRATNVGRFSGRITRDRGTGRDPGKVTRYPGTIDRTPGKLVTRDPGRYPGHGPRDPRRPIGRYPGHPVAIPRIPLTPGPGIVINNGVINNGVPPTINQVTSPPGGGGGQGGGQPGQTAQRGGFNPPPPGETRYVPNEVLLNIAANVTTPALDAIAQRNRLTRLELREFSMTGRRIARVRINDGRAVPSVIQSLQTEIGIAGAQPNYLFALEQAGSDPAADPTQYAYGKLHLSQAHALVRGSNVRVAVVDSMIDATHPDLAGAVAAAFDATGSGKPHFHGTGVAGVIAAHGKLTGAAPAVQILAATAFGTRDSRGTGMDILKALDWAGISRADIVNMSFTGPLDQEQQLQIKALRQRGAVLIAAAGNEGPSAPSAYPGAFPEVIAVTATDSDDALFDKANRGAYVALAAPGVAILVASPGGAYQMRSGTSFAAPQVSGIAALLLERNRKLDPSEVRSILTATAHDLGPPGRDDQFGAGLVDALSAVESAGMQPTEVSARGAQPAN